MWIKIIIEKENMSQEVKLFKNGVGEVVTRMSGNKTATHICKIVIVHRRKTS